MRLSKIKLAGFKSFVDPTNIEIPSNLVGVVGPNGCGKSNVIDAVRWVMGESSAKHLRGDSMEDVIFNGSASRKPVGTASIELFFDNSDGSIGGQYASYAEVSIRRLLSRDGTSQYFLNNVRCRRKDITGIFLGTGLGPRSYAIIEQGMISRFVEAKPEELRTYLEEAAGISKYKERRRETETRIRHTRDNLDRLNDVREEVEHQIKHLQKQARAAKRHKVLRNDQRLAEAELLAIKITEIDRELKHEQLTFEKCTTELESAIAAQRKVEAEIEEARESQNLATEEHNHTYGEQIKAQGEIARIEEAIRHQQLSREQQDTNLREARDHLAAITSTLNEDRGRVVGLDEKLAQLAPKLDAMRETARVSAESMEKVEAALTQWQDDWQSFNAELNEARRSIEVEQARIEHLETQQGQLSRQRDTLQAERENISLGEKERELRSKEQLETRTRDSDAELELRQQSLIDRLDELREKDRQLSDRLEQLKGQLEGRRASLMTMEALQEAALGRDKKPLKKWLEGRDLASRPLLAQRLKVNPPWEKAVETVLGEFLQAISVTEYSAHLDQLPDISLVLLNDASDAAALDRHGHSLLSQVERADGAAALLARVRLADSLQEALELRTRLGPDESVVTPEGIWLSRSWVRISATGKDTRGVISREQDIRDLQGQIEAHSGEVEEAIAARAAARNGIQQAEGQLPAVQADCRRVRQEHAQAYAEVTSLRQEVSQLQERLASISDGSEGVHSQMDTVRAQIEDARSRLAQTNEKQAKLAGREAALKAEQKDLLTRCEAARVDAERARGELQDLTIEVESCRSSRGSAGTTLERGIDTEKQLTDRINTLSGQITTGEQPLVALKVTLQAQLESKVAVDAELKKRRQTVEQATDKLRLEEAKRFERDREVSEIRETVDGMRVHVREFEVRRETVVEQLSKTGSSLETVMAELPEDAGISDWEAKLERLQRRIDRIGNVNLLAIEEFEEQSERKRYLDEQFEDLTSALETLEKAIRRIDRETRTRFQETFDNVNNGLKRIFPRLFGGGHAYLSLDGDDVLNAGVSVMARPPGKRISHIQLLSGGEKALTAVAMVFSIFELNPAPFCLLDEVDAPLDDANVLRFCEIVREMSETVQFLFITHNKITMELAGQLMGVTMHEPGVSRLVSVDIDEAVRLAVS